MIPLLFGVSFSTAFVPFLLRTTRHITRTALLSSAIVFLLACAGGGSVLISGVTAEGWGLWRVDALSALLVVLIGIIQWTGTIASHAYITREVNEGVITLPLVRRYYILLALFITTMLATVVADNLGLLWVMLEATTLTTTFLVAFYARPSSLEAAWKYLILCSTGIALSLVSLIIIYAAVTESTGLTGLAALQIGTLLSLGGVLPPAMLKIAFAFALVGYGTKMGLVPLHSWLPDAHSSAPAPISGLLSGILLTAAFLALLRYKAFTDIAIGSSTFTNGFFIVFGVLSALVSAAFILNQKDYKRLLAYSSIEHMGFAVFSIGLGGVGAVAAVLQVIGHALLKSMLFFGAGGIVLRFHSTKFDQVQGVIRVLPITGSLFFLGVLLLLAVPPSPLFVSEYLAIAAGIGSHPIAVWLTLLALVLAFAGFMRLVTPMIFGGSALTHPAETEQLSGTTIAMAIHGALALCLFVLYVTGYATPILTRVAEVIT